MNTNTNEKYQFNCPYLSLSKKTIIENKEELLSNLYFHILPYIAAANEQELKQYKALVSFNLMDVCIENYCDDGDKIKFITSTLGNKKTLPSRNYELKNIYQVYHQEYKFYLKNGGNDTLSSGVTYKNLNEFIEKNIQRLIVIYLIIQNLIRFSVYDKASYSLYNAKELTAISSEEDDETIWTTKYINTSWNQFKDASLLIFGLLHTIFEKNNLTNIFSPTKYISADKFEELKKYLSSEELKNIFCGYLNYDGYTADILGYVLYAQEKIKSNKNKHSKTNLEQINIPKIMTSKFGLNSANISTPPLTNDEKMAMENEDDQKIDTSIKHQSILATKNFSYK